MTNAEVLPRVINVPCATELLAQMEGEWSRPLQVQAKRADDGAYELVFREWDYITAITEDS